MLVRELGALLALYEIQGSLRVMNIKISLRGCDAV
jgi:hypothetical protein